MKRIHGLSVVVGMVFALGLVGACNAWQTSKHNQTNASPSMGAVFGGDGTFQERRQSNQNSYNSNASNRQYSSPSDSDGMGAADANMATVSFRSLPREAQTVIGTIKARGDFPYRQDGQVFSNRERVLPAQARGYYHEYTVPTPGADNRGARRVIAGSGSTGDVATSGEYYYTADHYRTFSRIKE